MSKTEVRAFQSPIELRADGDGRTLTALIAPFDSPAEINSWEGSFVETIRPGAFTKTIAERGSKIRLQFDHGMDSRVGSQPIGKIHSLVEEPAGLVITARLSNTAAGNDILELMKDGSLDGFSFRFEVVDDDWDKSQTPHRRELREVKLLEAGPVVYPAYSESKVLALRSDGSPFQRTLPSDVAFRRIMLLKDSQ